MTGIFNLFRTISTELTHAVSVTQYNSTQGSQQEVVKFQDKVFSKFQDILRSQNVENHYVLCTTNQSKHPNGAITISKAMLHKKIMLVSLKQKQKLKLDPHMK